MTSEQTKKRPADDFKEKVSEENILILHNDDEHSFDYVINALVDICKHEYEQATQCTIITHYKGKCDVKKGKFNVLKIMKDALIERELNATID
ncbi:ATP-dependent Clp protease adaptor ClpS [Maribellus maritimus]|uniref:ATP-dependent Clp protease adaptor ClpS n=1 Tax=Maribellus maritimus TaxID=2870838 RepID=UPI001EEC155E|nr:ATP-dependent Clp protease adaptor ClpS [Maribellus maritimus]MCG6189895.1 ATP-dependent Clp protease adaptor ClpS [Maribellus maritimus]